MPKLSDCYPRDPFSKLPCTKHRDRGERCPQVWGEEISEQYPGIYLGVLPEPTEPPNPPKRKTGE